MAGTTLGLDLGPNSIGWALINEAEGHIIATGVRVFPEGVKRDAKEAEASKNEARRIARGMRRQIARRARRKRNLRRLLIEVGLLPAADEAQLALVAIDPYELRRRALNERLTLHELGRLLVHLNQRRGFLSNRKVDKANKKENSDMLAEINSLADEIQHSGHRTLGEHLAALHEDPARRIRGRHTRRDMFEQEFEALWAEQQKRHPEVLTEELRQRIHRMIFFQRAIYWPKSVIGRCELEPKHPRCPRADRRAQRFRLFQDVNNLRVLDSGMGQERALTSEERSKVIDLLSRSKETKFDKIRKHLDLLETATFNLERGNRDKLQGLATDAVLSQRTAFGVAWHELPEQTKNAIVDVLLKLERNELSEEAAQRRASTWGVKPAQIDKILGIDLPTGYMNFSLEAIEKLLPHMERGLLLMTDDDSPCAMVEAGYLRPDQRPVRTLDALPQPPDLANPIVRQALHEVRKVVNAIIREHGRPDRIHIELAREVRGSARQRAAYSKQTRDRQAERDRAADKIRQVGFKPGRDAIERYLLWQEQNKICVYSGRVISLAQLLGGEVDADHIFPYSRSLDNSLANKVVCFRDANAEKANRTPWEWLGERDPARFETVCSRAAKLPYNKRRRFTQKNVDLDDFIARQLVDTAYISKAAAQYLRSLGAYVQGTKGQLTAELRWQWGLHLVLRDDGLNLKNRDDHRHHAVDAIVVALTNQRRLQQLSAIRRTGGTERTGEILPEPWARFRDSVEQAVNAINVSHRVCRKVAGALHKETIYGPTSTEGEYVYRKSLESITTAMVPAIRDDTIRRLVAERLAEHGIQAESKQRIPADVWKVPLTMPSGVPIKKVRLIKKDKTIRPIRGGAAHVKPGNLHHLCIFEFEDARGRLRREADFVSALEAASRLRNRQPLIQRTYPNRPEARFVMSLSKGESVLVEQKHKGRERLMYFSTAASIQGQIYLIEATDARPNPTRKQFAFNANTLRGKKVTVDPLGRLRWAHD